MGAVAACRRERRPRLAPGRPCPMDLTQGSNAAGGENLRCRRRDCLRGGGGAGHARGDQRIADAPLAPVQGAADAQRRQAVGAGGE